MTVRWRVASASGRVGAADATGAATTVAELEAGTGTGGGTMRRRRAGRAAARRGGGARWCCRHDELGAGAGADGAADAPADAATTTSRIVKGRDRHALDVQVAARNQVFPASVPAAMPWYVAVPNSTKLDRWTHRQSERGSRRIANDVTSMASSRYIATTPKATAPGFHADAMGNEDLGPAERHVAVGHQADQVDRR